MKRTCRLVLILFVFAAVASLFLPVPALAQAEMGEVVAADDAAAQQTMDWKEIIQNGGKLMYVLAGLSVLTITFVLYFFTVLRVGQVTPKRLHRELVEKIRAGAMDDARRACEYKACPLSAVALSAINYVTDVPDAKAMLVHDVVEGEGARQAEAIQGQTQYLIDIAAVAPMVGLLGTVFGMLRAFSSVALDLASAKPVNLAAGVSQALVTTAFGLIVGIVAMIFYAYFRRRATKMVATLEIAATDVLTALLSKGRGQSDLRAGE